MARFCDIIGQEHIKEHFINSIREKKVAHSYIINGEKFSGKEYIANIFAMALQCEEDDVEPCLTCHSCIQSASKNHPDIKTLVQEKPNTIRVEDIRNQIVDDVIIKPYSGKYKIYIINDAEKMTEQAQNALLKTFEEPPSYVVIILLTGNVSMLLPTIVSRSILINMRPVNDEDVRKYLMEEIKIPDYRADVCIAFARGNIGKAKHLASSEEFDNIKNDVIKVLTNIDEMDTEDFLKAVKQANDYKVSVEDYLDLCLIWYRDVLMYKALKSAEGLVFKEEFNAIKNRAKISSYEGIEKVVEAIEKTKQRLNANVNYELAMELMLLTVKEN